MPAMYPEELRRLREQNPGLQYDFRGNVVGAMPPDSVQMAADAIYQLPGMQPNVWDFGPTRNDYLNSKDFVGPMSQQWWDPNGELAQQGLSALVSGQDLPDVGFYSQWNPDTNSWVRHGSASDGLGMGASRSRGAARPSYGAPASARQRGFAPAGLGYEQQENPYMRISGSPASDSQDTLGDYPALYGA